MNKIKAHTLEEFTFQLEERVKQHKSNTYIKYNVGSNTCSGEKQSTVKEYTGFPVPENPGSVMIQYLRKKT